MERDVHVPGWKSCLPLAVLLTVVTWCSPTVACAQEIIPLWPDGPPDTNELSGPETGDFCIGNITEASLMLFHPDPNVKKAGAILVVPGGGYSVVCMAHEGVAVANWLTGLGFTVGVLKYRLPNSRYEVPLQDAQQALRLLRSRANEWSIEPGKIGILGFSAGGHLASTVGTHFLDDYSGGAGARLDVSHRPDFMILAYPVVTMVNDLTHQGSRLGLLGENPDPELVDRFSNQLRVTRETPPTFRVHSGDDQAVHPFNSLKFYRALLDQGVSAELHQFEQGGHGYALAPESPAHAWKLLAEDWLERTVQKGQ